MWLFGRRWSIDGQKWLESQVVRVRLSIELSRFYKNLLGGEAGISREDSGCS